MRTLLLSKPGDFSTYLELGNVLYSQGKYRESADIFRASLRLHPSSSSAHNNLGAALSAAELYNEAIPHFRRALQINPMDSLTLGVVQ